MGVIYAPSMLERIPRKGSHEARLRDICELLESSNGTSGILHGSVVVGAHRINSDIDAVIFLGGESSLNRRQIGQYISDVFKEYAVSIEATIIDPDMPSLVVRALFNDPIFNIYLLELDELTAHIIGTIPDEFLSILIASLNVETVNALIDYGIEKLTKTTNAPFFNSESEVVLKNLQRRLEMPKALKRKLGRASLGDKTLIDRLLSLDEYDYLQNVAEDYVAVLESHEHYPVGQDVYTSLLAELYEDTYEPARELMKTFVELVRRLHHQSEI